jgi:hypothetical protein
MLSWVFPGKTKVTRFFQVVGVSPVASHEGDLVPYQVTEIQRNDAAHAHLGSASDLLAVEEVENIHTS